MSKRAVARAKEAANLEKAMDRLWASMDKIPSFTGKSGFMDKVLKAQGMAHNLAWELDMDAREAREEEAA